MVGCERGHAASLEMNASLIFFLLVMFFPVVCIVCNDVGQSWSLCWLVCFGAMPLSLGLRGHKVLPEEFFFACIINLNSQSPNPENKG